MNITALLLGTLTSCTSTWNCNPDEEDFDVDEELTTADIDQIVADWGLDSVDELDCDTACRFAYSRTRGWEMDSSTSCTLDLPVDEDNPGSVSCTGHGYEYFCEGRRPQLHVHASAQTPLQAMAHLEAASVLAFEELAAQLVALGAPAEFSERCLAASQDERNHARWLGQLSGVEPLAVPLQSACDLQDMALHNAVEGCVHETFAALAGLDRARRMDDPELRRVFLRIAQDELRHAQLAWDLHDWFLTRVEDPAAIEAGLDAALAALPDKARRQALDLGADPEEFLDLAHGLRATLRG